MGWTAAVRRQLEFGTKRQIVDIPTLFSTKEMDEVLLLSAICNDDLNNLASISGLVTRGTICCCCPAGDTGDCTNDSMI